jgi:hypothetical protein
MAMNYEYDDGTPSNTINVDEGVEDPVGDYWENNCPAWSKRDCKGYEYYGGRDQCAQGHEIWRVIDMTREHPGANKIHFRGKIWTVDSWDGETARVQMIN